MTFTCTLPDQEGTVFEFKRSSFRGSLSIKAIGRVVDCRSGFNPLNHFSLSLTRYYEFTLPGPMPSHVSITKERPLLLAGFRRNRYLVSFNGMHIGQWVGF